MDLQRIKKAAGIVLLCVFGMMVMQFAAPIILGILVQSLSFAVPIAVYHFFVKKKWRIQLVREQEEPEKEEEAESVPSNHETEESQKMAYNWYMETGRQRINAMISELSSRGITECWLRSDGICNIRTDKGFRRAGTLPGYPAKEAEVIAALLVKDGRNAQIHKRYLYVSWNGKQEG